MGFSHPSQVRMLAQGSKFSFSELCWVAQQKHACRVLCHSSHQGLIVGIGINDTVLSELETLQMFSVVVDQRRWLSPTLEYIDAYRRHQLAMRCGMLICLTSEGRGAMSVIGPYSGAACIEYRLSSLTILVQYTLVAVVHIKDVYRRC